eukprot:6196437-Pleurochrysis_carterae.AAC.1
MKASFELVQRGPEPNLFKRIQNDKTVPLSSTWSFLELKRHRGHWRGSRHFCAGAPQIRRCKRSGMQRSCASLGSMCALCLPLRIVHCVVVVYCVLVRAIRFLDAARWATPQTISSYVRLCPIQGFCTMAGLASALVRQTVAGTPVASAHPHQFGRAQATCAQLSLSVRRKAQARH